MQSISDFDLGVQSGNASLMPTGYQWTGTLEVSVHMTRKYKIYASEQANIRLNGAIKPVLTVFYR